MPAPAAPPPFPYIADVAGFSPLDMPCLDELREVLTRHGAVDRFGLTLLHSHFALAPDETLVEDTDEANRSQTITVVKKTAIPAGAKYTSWRFDTHEAAAPVCRIHNQYC